VRRAAAGSRTACTRTSGLVALLALTLAASACGGPAVTPSVPATAAPTEAISPGLPATEPPATEPPATAPPGATPSAATVPAGAVIEDPSLLAVLPPDVGGIKVAHEPAAFADAAGDKAFASNVQSAAFAVAVDGENLASAVVARLNPETYTETFFREWRDSYNDGACGQSGGLVGNAETRIGDQAVFIGSCAGGLRTYHAWVESRGVIVSAFSLGDRKLGELLMEGLRP
jgi:hypothetical protein